MINRIQASVVIVTQNQKRYLEQSLPILLDQKISCPFEIIVVDSGSTDGAVEYVKSLPKVKLLQIPSHDFRFARAFNRGAKLAAGKYLVRLSGDVIPLKKNFLEELLKPFEDPGVGATYGKYTISGKLGWVYPIGWGEKQFPSQQAWIHCPVKFLFGLNIWDYMGSPDNMYDFLKLAGGCCAIRRSIWQLRSFNEKIWMGEDSEYAWFLHLIGFDIVYVPEAIVLHEHRENKLYSFQASYALTRWQWYNTSLMMGYWLKRIFGKDPYKGFYQKLKVND